MFCSLGRQYSNVDHYILQLSSLDIVDLYIEEDGQAIDIPECKFSLVIYGGFDPGTYEIYCGNKYVQYFILKDGKEMEAGVIDQKLTVKLERYDCTISR